MAVPEWMAQAVQVEFFYGLGSRYSYLAATQIERLKADTGCRVSWQPLYSGDLFRARGADPFAGQPVSGQYDRAWRKLDAERWADYYGVPFREPSNVTFDGGRLALAATAAARLGMVERFSRRLFQAVFADGTTPLDDERCIVLATELGVEAEPFRRTLDEPATSRQLAATVERALGRGIFGVPTFVIGDQVFWGNDRLPLVRHALEKRAGICS